MNRSLSAAVYFMISFVMIGQQFPFAVAFSEDLFTIHSVDQCYGKQISAICENGQLLRVITATYRQTADCSSSSYFESHNNCSREAPSDAPCTGNGTCHFLSPWIYLSSQCGYSNNFIVKYQCIPEHYQTPICSRVTLTDIHGFLTSPGYPWSYPPSTECTVTVVALPGGRIRIQLIDLQLSHYRSADSGDVICTDRLWMTDGFNQSEYLCTGHKSEQVFMSVANQLTIHFTSGHQISKPAKGFWLYYETIPDKNVKLQTILPAATASTPAPLQTYLTPSAVQVEFVRLFSPPMSVELEKTRHREEMSNDIGMLTSADESHGQAADASPLGFAYSRDTIEFGRNVQNGAEDVEMVDDYPRVFPNSLIHLRNAEIHPDLVVEMIPLRGNVRVESRIVSSWTTTTTSPVAAVEEELGLQRPEHHHHQPLKIGVVEFSVMAGVGSCAVVIVVSVVVGLFFYLSPSWPPANIQVHLEYYADFLHGKHLRKRRKMVYGEKIAPKKNYRNVIFAFGNEETPCSTPEMEFSNQTFDGSSSVTPYSWSWNGRNTNSRNGLVPIDEKMEDLYAEVKQCGLKADPARIQANAEAIKARSRSKSVDYTLRKKLPPGSERNTKLALPSGSSQIQSLNIELLGCRTRSPWSSRSLGVGSVTFRRDLPSRDIYGRFGEEFGKGRSLANPRGMHWASARWERPGSTLMPTICAQDPRLFYIHCSTVPKLTASPIVDMPYEANLLEHEDVTL